MSKYTEKDLPQNRGASTPVFVENIEQFSPASEIFQLLCAVGYGDGGAAVKLAKYILARSSLVKGTSLDPALHRVGPYAGYAGQFGVDRAVAFLEYAIHCDAHNGEAHYYLGHCFEKEMGWHYRAVGTWDRDYRNPKAALEEYRKASADGYSEAFLATSLVLESMYQRAYPKDPNDMNLAAYAAMMAVAKGVKGARERYADLQGRGFDGGNLRAIFLASYPGVKL